MSREYRVLVCGGRNFANRLLVFETMRQVSQGTPRLLHVVQGGAEGADALAREWAQTVCVPFTTYPANWRRDGKSAGPLRNQQMIETEPDLVVAFPGGRGTADMIRRARLHEVPVMEVANA